MLLSVASDLLLNSPDTFAADDVDPALLQAVDAGVVTVPQLVAVQGLLDTSRLGQLIQNSIDGGRGEPMAAVDVFEDEPIFPEDIDGVIDGPSILDWVAYIGGDSFDSAAGVAVDRRGNVFVVGETDSAGWVSGGFDTTYNGDGDGFVAKFNRRGEMLWSTYLGGAGFDTAAGVAVDRRGNVVVVGSTQSLDWVEGGVDTTFNGDQDAFVVKLSRSGAFIWSTFLGGAGFDVGLAVDVNGGGAIVVGGITDRGGWVADGFDTAFSGDTDGFVVKLNRAGEHLWSTFVGGDQADGVFAVDINGRGKVFAAGGTRSDGWVFEGFDTTLNGAEDGFAIKLTSKGEFVWSSFIGGDGADICLGIAVHTGGVVYVTGDTFSSGWVSGGFDTTYGGNGDGFVVKLSTDGRFRWSTFVGGEGADTAAGIDAAARGNIVITGETESPDWVSGGFQTEFGGVTDAYVVKLSRRGTQRWSSYLGGEGDDSGAAIVASGRSTFFVVGFTDSFDLAFNTFDVTFGGAGDGFLAKITDRGGIRTLLNEVASLVTPADIERLSTVVPTTSISTADSLSALLRRGSPTAVPTTRVSAMTPQTPGFLENALRAEAQALVDQVGEALDERRASRPGAVVPTTGNRTTRGPLVTAARLANTFDALSVVNVVIL